MWEKQQNRQEATIVLLLKKTAGVDQGSYRRGEVVGEISKFAKSIIVEHEIKRIDEGVWSWRNWGRFWKEEVGGLEQGSVQELSFSFQGEIPCSR